MGKSKKIKKGTNEGEGDSDVEVEVPVSNKESVLKSNKPKVKSKVEESVISDEEENVKATKKKVKKGGEEEKMSAVTKDMKKMDVGTKKVTKKKVVVSDDDDSETDDSDDSVPKSKAKKPQQKPGFSLLLMDDSEESEPSSEDHSEESEEEKPVIIKKKPPPQKEPPKEQGKKGKKAKKKKDDSDDDIDKVLAELELEYSGKKPPPSSEPLETVKPSEDRSKKKKEEPETKTVEGGDKDDDQEDQEVSAVKSAAQKKKEKKEREKLKKQAAKKQEASGGKKEETPQETIPVPTKAEPENNEDSVKPDESAEVEGEETGDKKKKKKKGDKEKVEDKSKKPAKKAIAAMQEALKKIKEEEERLQREEEERIRQEEERERQRLEQLRIEKEKKDKKKKKEKERKEKLKAEGKFLTPKQKADKARALAMIESLKNQGGGIEAEKKAPRLGTRIKPNKLKKQTSDEQAGEEGNKVNVEIVDDKGELKKDEVKKETIVKDSWDAESSSSDNEEDEDSKPEVIDPVQTKPANIKGVPEKKISPVKQKEEESSSEESDSDDESDTTEDEDEKKWKVQEREKAITRMKKRQEENEAKKSESVMRAAIVCVLGHVDTGKTKILDKLRRTNVQDGEAGGITQQIGATNVPIENIKEQTRHVKGVNTIGFKIPGLLIIDTPGHESFSNLRSRGSSLCDIAILVVDIMHGLEPQTKESINLLKARKTPFVVALNKIDRLYDWQSAQRKDIKDIIKSQHTHTQSEFENRTKEVILQFANEGLNAALYYENPDVRSYVSLVPTSAITGEGMGNLLALIIQLCENMLHKRLLFSETLQATVLEVKAIPGLGTTIDAILINGTLRETDTIVLAGTEGPIVTQIRSLLMPQPMKELRVKNAYIEYKEIVAAQGVKIAAKDLEKAVAGLNLQVAHKPDEIEILKEEVSRELKSALSSIKLSERGVYVQASTLGSLEALLEFLKTSSIPYSSIKIGPVVKRDVMKASAMLEHESQYAVILAFDVKIERDAQELADSLGVTIFQADIIYHLFDKFMAHRNALKARKREEFKHIAVFPCKLKVMPQFVFNSRDPIVVGVMIEAGIVKEGTPICVPSKEFVDIGIISSIESNHKQVESARKGMEVCVKIDPIPGESPKMFGRHFDETDFLVSKISRASIDACKDYFREDLLKTDWQLMVELKNLFQIL